MGREISSNLARLLAIRDCYTQSTLSLIPVTGQPIHLSTKEISFDGIKYRSGLIRIDEIRQSIGVSTDMLTGETEQVTKVFGLRVAAEELVKAVGIVGRYYRHPTNTDLETWVELFRGEFIARAMTEEGTSFEIVHDLVAAGFCVCNWTLAENCQFVFKHAETCGYAGDLAACNKKRKSMGGCFGRDNEEHFGGMEFPDIQVPEPPITGGGGGIGGGGNEGGFPPSTCPVKTNYVLVRGRGYQAVPKLVSALTMEDELFHPVWKTFHEIDALRVVPNQPVWRIAAENGAAGESSFSHPVLWYREHSNGTPVERFLSGDPVLTTKARELIDTTVSKSEDTGRTADVVAISMVDGHIYCYSERPEGPFIVCHNKPSWEGGYVN